MNDRQRLEAIVAVVCRYLPPDGISREEAMSQIIALVDPLPAQPEQEPVDLLKQSEREGWRYANECELEIKRLRAEKREWVGLTDEEIQEMANDFEEGYVFLYRSFAAAIEAKLKEKNDDT